MHNVLFLLAIFGAWLLGLFLLSRNSKKAKRRRRFERWRRRMKTEENSPVETTTPVSKSETEVEESDDPCDWVGTPDQGYPDKETIDFNCQSFVDVIRSGPFLFKPAIQIGRQKPSLGSGFEIVWAALDDDGDWRVEIVCGEPCATATVSALEKQPVRLQGLTPHCLMRVSVGGLNAGQRLEYRVFRDGLQVFAATTTAPLGAEAMAHRFAVDGDRKCGSQHRRTHPISTGRELHR